MKIEHIAIWVKDLEVCREFYQKYFKMQSSEKYVNPKKKFSSCFLSLEDGETRIEIMHNPEVVEALKKNELQTGLTHFAFSVGGRDKVDLLTEYLRADGYIIKGEPRVTGDGYYESVVLDPEGNAIEISE